MIVLIGYSGWQVHTLSSRQEQNKKDYSIVNSVSFGLLSVDLWRDQIISAASAQVKDYRLSASQQEDLRKEKEQILHGLVGHAFAVIN